MRLAPDGIEDAALESEGFTTILWMAGLPSSNRQMQVRGHRQLQEVTSQEPGGEKQHFQVLHLSCHRVLNSESSFHVPTVTGSGKNAGRLFPWVHTLIANVKGNIRGVYHGVSDKHLPRYLDEFCYRFNRRFWEPQMFNRQGAAPTRKKFDKFIRMN